MKEKAVIKNAAFREKRKRQLIFYCILLAFPVLQFCVFYLGVNLNSIMLMFKKYDILEGYSFVGFENFVNVFEMFTSPTAENHEILINSFKNSLILGFFTIVVGIGLSVVFSYYIFKKYRLSEMFKVILFLPNIISSVVFVIIFQKFCDAAIPKFIQALFGIEVRGLLSDVSTRLPTLMFYTIWAGFGVQVMMYSGAMSAVSTSMLEACELDGCNDFKEFWYIVVPQIYPTITTFVVVNVATIFTNQMNLFSFYGPSALLKGPDITTMGYFLYKEAYTGELARMPSIATLGFYMTVLTIPVTYLIKYLMERFGPSEESKGV